MTKLRAKPRKKTKTMNINGRRNEREWKKETYGKGRVVITPLDRW